MSSAKNLVAVVTGTNSGLGLVLTVKLAKSGLYRKVYAGMRGFAAKPDKAADLQAAVADASVADVVEVIELDQNDDKSVQTAFEQVVAKEDRVDLLVNNAGYAVIGCVEQVTMDEVKAQFEANVFGVIRCQKGVLPSMRKNGGGKIVNISSVGGVFGQPFNDVYCSSKFALEGLIESQQAVFRGLGIYQTSVQPGGIKTKFTANAKMPDFSGIPKEYGPALQKTLSFYTGEGEGEVPKFGDPMEPEEVAQAIMDQVITVDKPPAKMHTHNVDRVCKIQLADPTGEAGVEWQYKSFGFTR